MLAPAVLPALMSDGLSPTMRQSQIWTSMALRAFIRASGEGLGLCVSWAVMMCVKYWARRKCCNSFVSLALGTLRIVMRASFAFCWSVFRAIWMLGMGLVFTSVMA